MAGETTRPGPHRVRVASYNIRKGVGLDRRRDPLRILRVLGEIDADIVALQEADRRFGLRESVLPQVLIENHTDYEAVPLDVQTDSMGWHGNAILVKKGIAIEAHDIIHIPCLEPRGVVTATLSVRGRSLAVFGMHLDLSGLWRTRQARAIADLAAEARIDHPTVLMGDLNEWRGSAGTFREFGRHFEILDCGPSFHAARPVGRLDRIMHCERLMAKDCGVHRSALASRASDHLPVWADFAFA
ncbi:Metal-dependent hydrolase, endonuclease/exonuclease/phosphatase family [Erythrobacter litoralis]|jgi:endonuclease/exonuclease/phosphatase family metal-dependent hydrolase|uniref:Endonuclease n=1 Tax=Erythrobacter litoralis TaxID=39960 RepID=A0A074N3G0_9SPHN|nr:endonuclease/exonuclease/phosphatase family protein [Erythrobacter litoralis]AOL23824.1 Metal-dependent hydrolase, endonuclease/exonuclease/phosphatase family [Erythrobacter litoralis]KEO98693.1 endonuclease [Erythrobacter litoralis]MEE4339022.1 endonuclease/exonuclease/phosphatase family protein [Erythrobacter sp.]